MFVSPAVRAASEAELTPTQRITCEKIDDVVKLQKCIDDYVASNIAAQEKAKTSKPEVVRCDTEGVKKKCRDAFKDAQGILSSGEGERVKDYAVANCLKMCSYKEDWVANLIEDCGNLGKKSVRTVLDEIHVKCPKQGSLESKAVTTDKGAYVVPCTDSLDCKLKENEIKDPNFVAEKRAEASPWTFGLAQGEGVYDPETGAMGYEYNRETTAPPAADLLVDGDDEAKGLGESTVPVPRMRPTCAEDPAFCPASIPPADGGTTGREPAKDAPVAEQRPARETPSRETPSGAEPQVAQTNSGSNGSSSGGTSGGSSGGFPGGTSGGSSTSGFASNPYNPNLLSSSEAVSNRGSSNGGSEVTSNGGSFSGGSSSGGSSGRSRGFGDRRGDNNTPEAAANLGGTAVASNRGGLSTGGGSTGERERGMMVASVDRSAPLLQGAKYYRGAGAKPLAVVKPKPGKKPVRTRKKLPLDPSTMRASLVKKCNGNTQCVLTVMGMSNQKLMVYRASDRGIASDFSLRGRDKRIPAEVGYGTHDVISAVNRMVDHFQLDEEGDIDYGDEY